MKRLSSGPIFRLIDSSASSPAHNMAVDEVLFRGCLDGGPPCLRFYAWDPPGLSLGRLQRELGGIDLEFCRREGIPVVRRLTGGRAVFHHRELTYSLASRYVPPFVEGGVVAVSRLIAVGLASGLARLGAETVLAGRSGPRGRHANCFASVSQCELTWRGRKLVGSAQARERGGFLQHGSILIRLEERYWRGIFGPDALMTRDIVGLATILGRDIEAGDLAAALWEGLREELGAGCRRDGLTPGETAAASRLAREKYAGETDRLRVD